MYKRSLIDNMYIWVFLSLDHFNIFDALHFYASAYRHVSAALCFRVVCLRDYFLARYLSNQWTEFHQTMIVDEVEAKDELIRFWGQGVKVKVASRSDKSLCNLYLYYYCYYYYYSQLLYNRPTFPELLQVGPVPNLGTVGVGVPVGLVAVHMAFHMACCPSNSARSVKECNLYPIYVSVLFLLCLNEWWLDDDRMALRHFTLHARRTASKWLNCYCSTVPTWAVSLR